MYCNQQFVTLPWHSVYEDNSKDAFCMRHSNKNRNIFKFSSIYPPSMFFIFTVYFPNVLLFYMFVTTQTPAVYQLGCPL